MIVIGLTGGIASGKSTISSMLEKLGATIIDVDKVGHEAYQPHTVCWREVVETFGQEIVKENEEIDRRKLGAIVFQDPAALKKLNAIMHLRMREMVEERIESLKRQGVEAVVVDAAILIEANWTPIVDEVWVVSVPEEVAIQRLMSRNGYSREEAEGRLRAQMPVAEKAKFADVVVDNSRPLDEVEEDVKEIWDSIEERVRARR